MSSDMEFFVRRVSSLKKRAYNLARDTDLLIESMYPLEACYFEDALRYMADANMNAYNAVMDAEREARDDKLI